MLVLDLLANNLRFSLVASHAVLLTSQSFLDFVLNRFLQVVELLLEVNLLLLEELQFPLPHGRLVQLISSLLLLTLLPQLDWVAHDLDHGHLGGVRVPSTELLDAREAVSVTIFFQARRNFLHKTLHSLIGEQQRHDIAVSLTLVVLLRLQDESIDPRLQLLGLVHGSHDALMSKQLSCQVSIIRLSRCLRRVELT